MSDVWLAVGAALSAPFRRCGLALLLWLARLLPIALLFGLPAFDRIREQSARHPDAGLLLDPAADPGGAAANWLRYVFEGLEPQPGRWLVVAGAASWLLVTLLAGGITARLLGSEVSLFRACARYGWRFVRLGLLVLLLIAGIQMAVGGFLREAHAAAEANEFTQDLLIGNRTFRGTLLLLSAWVVWLLHSCARIDLVARGRRSVLRSVAGGVGLLLERLPALLLVEACMLVLTGVVALLVWLICRVGLPARADAGWGSLGALLVAGTLVSYLRTGLELGHFEARCRLLGPLYRDETPALEIQPDQEPSPDSRQ